MTGATAIRTGAAVALTGLHKAYGDVHAVDGVDLMISPGEVVALLGSNGAGKSTTVAETVGLIAALHRRPLPVSEALQRADIADLADRKCTKLSGGQKQRVRFALALVCDPDLLVLDEPTVAMDVETRRQFWKSMRDFTDSGRTVLFATHYLEEAQEYADRVVLMRAGRVVADGSVAEVRATVSRRRLRAVVPGVAEDVLAGLPGVRAVELRADRVSLACTDSGAALRALLAAFPHTHDIEINAAGLEDAFLALTGTGEDDVR
jgi:ABC-2 type transport system ATP-binding protein